MAERPTFQELSKRMTADRGQAPFADGNAAAWYGYLAALLEWNLISVEEHRKLCGLLPDLADNPAVRILVGKGD